jgi:3-methyladenine DNA glycosylase Tag
MSAKKVPTVKPEVVEEELDNADLIKHLEKALKSVKNEETILQIEYQLAQLKSGS